MLDAILEYALTVCLLVTLVSLSAAGFLDLWLNGSLKKLTLETLRNNFPRDAFWPEEPNDQLNKEQWETWLQLKAHDVYPKMVYLSSCKRCLAFHWGWACYTAIVLLATVMLLCSSAAVLAVGSVMQLPVTPGEIVLAAAQTASLLLGTPLVPWVVTFVANYLFEHAR